MGCEMNQTSKSASELQRGDRLRFHIDSAVVSVQGVRKHGASQVVVSYRYQGETERAIFNNASRVTVITD